MQSRSMLALYYVALAADDLDRIEEAVPDTAAGQRKRAVGRAFLCEEHVPADDKRHDGGNDRALRYRFPVILIDKHAQELAEVDARLCKASLVFQCLIHGSHPLPVRQLRLRIAR